jgi:hypothetical protein
LQENPHTPLLQLAVAWETPVVQVTAEPQAPLELQVSTPLPEHVVAPTAQEPAQAPDTQVVLTQATAEP